MDQQLLSAASRDEILSILKTRFEKNPERHPMLKWTDVQAKLEKHPAKLWSLNEMEMTGGEPDVVTFDPTTSEYLFVDCAAESPKGRRSTCYDHEALISRKEHQPENDAISMATDMGIEILTAEQYQNLQHFGPFDTKTSSWILTPESIRSLGGALFCDYRYGTTFVYHNGASSYYAARGFRGLLKV